MNYTLPTHIHNCKVFCVHVSGSLGDEDNLSAPCSLSSDMDRVSPMGGSPCMDYSDGEEAALLMHHAPDTSRELNAGITSSWVR